MASSKPRATLADYLVIALSPLLIMVLVGSLVFFLVEILYAGNFGERLRWILFCFVFGSVLVARISIENHSGRAGLYGFVLAGSVWVALLRFVTYDDVGMLAGLDAFVNAFLVGVTVWSTNRLTWDCTYVDDNVDASGEGLLQTAGLDEVAPEAAVESAGAAEADDDGPATPRRKKDRKARAKPTGLAAWGERYRKYREERRGTPHNPGVWVVYFSLAALPIFGLGQSLIPYEDAARRENTFWLMVAYVGSGLGLLLTTSFLGLRRYLRQRQLEMPAKTTGVWLTVGGALIAVLLAVGAVLPRPYPEYALLDPARLVRSQERSASDWATSGDDPGTEDGAPSSEKTSEDKGTPGSQTRPGNKDAGKGKDKGGSKSAKGKQPGKDGKAKGDDPKDSPKNNDDKQPRDHQDAKDQKSTDAGDKKNDKSSPARRSGSGRASAPRSGIMPRLPAGTTNAIRIVIYAIAALVALYFAIKFLANFTHWARALLDGLRNFWAGLFGKTERTDQGQTEAAAEAARPGPVPFSAFRDPFLTGAEMAPDELVRYSFEALEALARDRDLGREKDETPLEFAGRIGAELPALGGELRTLAGLYVRAAYSRSRLSAAQVEPLRQFWEHLDAVSHESVGPR